MADERLISLMIKMAKRMDIIEAQMIELQGFVGFVKQEKQRKKREEEELSEETKMRNIEYETLKNRLGDL